MMITVNRFKDNITGSVDGHPFGVVYTAEKLEAMKGLEAEANKASSVDELRDIIERFKLLTQESYSQVIEASSPYLKHNPATGNYHLYLPDKKVTSSKKLPAALVRRLIESVELSIDPLPIVKFMVRLLRNPRYTDDKAVRLSQYIDKTYISPKIQKEALDNGVNSDVARERATVHQTPLTLEGLLVTYKVVEEINWKFIDDGSGGVKQVSRYESEVDEITGARTHKKPKYAEDFLFQPCVQKQSGDAFYCDDKPGHIIRVGAVHYLASEDQIDSNDSVGCRPGLHCGNLDYIRGYQKDNTSTLNTFVDPMDVRAVPDTDGAIRVKRFMAYNLFNGVNKSLYHSSEYAKVTDKVFHDWLEEVVTGVREDPQVKIIEELKTLA